MRTAWGSVKVWGSERRGEKRREEKGVGEPKMAVPAKR